MGGISNAGRFIGLFDSQNNPIEDTIGRSLVVSDIDHWLIHEGRTWIHSNSATVLAAGNKDILVINGALGDVHIKDFLFTSSQANATLQIYSGTTVSANGTQKTWINKNIGDQADTPQSAIYEDPTVTGAGTRLELILMTGTKQSGGTVQGGGDEWVLPANGKMLFRFTNNAGTTDAIAFNIKVLDVGGL